MPESPVRRVKRHFSLRKFVLIYGVVTLPVSHSGSRERHHTLSPKGVSYYVKQTSRETTGDARDIMTKHIGVLLNSAEEIVGNPSNDKIYIFWHITRASAEAFGATLALINFT